MAHETAVLVQLHDACSVFQLVVADGNDRFRVVACLASAAAVGMPATWMSASSIVRAGR